MRKTFSYNANYPKTRLRRLRSQPWLRELVAEHDLSVNDLIWPVFVQEGEKKETPIKTLPGVSRYSIDLLVKQAKAAHKLGIQAIALFPVVPAKYKSQDAAHAWDSGNLACRAVRALKKAVPTLGIICDVALDPYTSHGQDGLVKAGKVLNDETVEALCKQSVALAEAGCDIVAPSDMMDGRVSKIRKALDKKGLEEVLILSYTAKYASHFYGPFRDAVGSAGALGKADKKTYQMAPTNSDEALREMALDIKEGADIIMVKPGMPYLDIVERVSSASLAPVWVYQVSGEYAMLKAAAKAGALDFEAALLESLIAFKRAGAGAVLTYGAVAIALRLKA